MKRLTLLLLVCMALLTSEAWPQDLVQNWSNKKQDFGTQDVGSVKLVVQGTNTFYYFYSILTTSTSNEPSAFDALLPFITTLVRSGRPGCVANVEDTLTAIDSMAKPERDNKTQVFSSIPVADTILEWKTKVERSYSLAYRNCTPAQQNQPEFIKVKTARNLLFPADGVPSVTVNIKAQPCKNYTVTITELFSGQQTAAAPLVATFNTTCDRVTFSGGPLFTEIGNPTYASRPSPTQAGQFLSVENTGRFRATLTGLVNLNMPWHRSGFLDPFRLGVSTGPVFQNSQSGTSSFGWFVGGSTSIFKYAYLSAGEHWGSFPDTPFGFTKGASIPANFGQLTPVDRHTWRFAFAVTFRVADLSKVFSGGNATPSGSAAPTSKPAVPVAPPPATNGTPASPPNPDASSGGAAPTSEPAAPATPPAANPAPTPPPKPNAP